MESLFKHVTKFCADLDVALSHKDNPSEEEEATMMYLDLNFAKAVLQDVSENDARRIAKIILAYCGKKQEDCC